MDFQQSHGHLPPPPPPPPQPPQPPMTDIQNHHHHQQQTLPVPPPNPWYSTQFQYQHPSPPPSYPPPPHQPWPQMLPQSHSDHFPSGFPPPPPYPTNSPYHAHHQQHNQYPPRHQYPLPPRPHNMPPPHQISQSYPQANQDWGNANWVHHQNWEYQGHAFPTLANTNEDAWAAKARAWAASNVASDSQPLPYVYVPKDGNVSGDSTAMYPGRDSSLSSLGHQQEVSSSYSSIAGDPLRGVEPAAAMSSGYTFVPPAEHGFSFSSVPTVDPLAMLSSPLSTHSTPGFGRMPGPSFHSTVSSVGPYSIGAGPDLHTITALPGDAYGVSGVPERPKKASVPNWLREEIIKNKPALVSSAAESPKENALSNDVDSVYKSYGKNGTADSKSADFSRSVGDDDNDDDDEDEVEAARTAAINKEIKRVLTEVLLKVTDELFDEIATKVLTDDDPSVEDYSLVTNSDEKVIPTKNGFGRVGAPDDREKAVLSTTSEKSAPSSTGDVLGLANYVSDDDEEDEHQSSEKPILNENNVKQEMVEIFSEGTKAARDSDFIEETRKNPQSTTFAELDQASSIVSQLGGQRDSRGPTSHDSQVQLKMGSIVSEQVVMAGKLKDNLVSKNVVKSEKSVDVIVSRNSTINDSLGQEMRVKSDKSHRDEDRKKTVDKDHNKLEKETAFERGYKTQNRHEERLVRTDKRGDQKVSRDKSEDKVAKSAEKTKDSDSKRKSPPDISKVLEKEKDKERVSIRDDNERKRERKRDLKRDESRHTNGRSSSRHKRPRSSSVASRDRDNNASDLSNESSDYSKRKPHSRRQRSPSPATVRSRKRQVSRSPLHSKHSQSQHRHSSYSSLESSRKRRSRSRSMSPIRRRR